MLYLSLLIELEADVVELLKDRHARAVPGDVSVPIEKVHVVHADVLGELELLLDLGIVEHGCLIGEGDHEMDLRVRVVLRVVLRTKIISRELTNPFEHSDCHEAQLGKSSYLDERVLPLLLGLEQGLQELLEALGPNADGQLGDLERVRVRLVPDTEDSVPRSLAILVFHKLAL